jgi:CRP-like cAMP-binding protein
MIDLGALEDRGQPHRYAAGARLFLQGDPSDSVILIRSGTVKVVALTVDGDERILALLSAGEVLGEIGAVDGAPRSADAWAVDDVDAVVVPRAEFLDHLAEHPGTALGLLESTVGKLRDTVRAEAEYGTTSVTCRVAGRLTQLATTHGTSTEAGVEISVVITQTELAQWVGATRESVARSLSSLRRTGLVGSRGRKLVVHDAEALAAIASPTH